MENNEYSKLIDFLGRKFEAMDDRFEKMDGRFDAVDKKFKEVDSRFDAMDSRFDVIEQNMATKEELEGVERRTGIQIEALDHKIDLVIEGQQGIIQKLNRHIEENESEHKRLEHMVMEDRADIYNIKKRLS